jgi:hypothetical protein
MSDAGSKGVPTDPEHASKGVGFGVADAAIENPSLKVGEPCPGPVLSRKTLENVVDAFVAELRQEFPSRMKARPAAFKKRLINLIRLKVPPRPKPGGRPRQSWITRAVEMYLKQRRLQRETGKPVNWTRIAEACIPGFRKIRSIVRRRYEIDKLRDAVYARLRLRKTKKRRRFGQA